MWIDISFATDRHFHPGLIFVFKAGVYPGGVQNERQGGSVWCASLFLNINYNFKKVFLI